MSKNFHCNDCEEEFFVPTYIASYSSKGVIYKDKRRNELKCSKCESVNIEVIRETINYTEAAKEGGSFVGKFASASNEEKKKILLKRAGVHNAKPSTYEEKKHRDKVQVNKTIKKING